MQVKIDTGTCDRCGTCISVCPCDALLLTEKLMVDSNVCTGCGTCVDICPVKALMLEQVT